MECLWCMNPIIKIHNVKTSLIGANVFHCENCNLIQSHYNHPQYKHRHKSISSDADWGNVRHGKGVRLDKSIKCLNYIMPEINSVCDIGSNRGHFCKWVSQEYPNVSIDMIEPDKSVCDYNFKYNDFINNRFENISLDKKSYDLVYCCQTLEHIDEIHDFFRKVKNTCKKYLFIDVPNIEILYDTNQNLIEEFFIDKHVLHFSKDVLVRMCDFYGFKIVEDRSDIYNITMLFQPTYHECKFNSISYSEKMFNDRQMLKRKGEKINELSQTKKVVIYGATRIYDALIKYGKLDKTKLYYLVDDYLNLPDVYRYDKLKQDKPDIVIVLARSCEDVICNKLKNLDLEIMTFEIL